MEGESGAGREGKGEGENPEEQGEGGRRGESGPRKAGGREGLGGEGMERRRRREVQGRFPGLLPM